MIRTEHQLYEQIARYLQLQYPKVIYRFDLAADLKLTMGQAAKHKRLHPRRGFPDLFIAAPRRDHGPFAHHGWYAGLFLEIKKDGTRLFKKDGTPATPHVKEQLGMISGLIGEGYKADFAVGFEDAKKKIDDYLKGTNETQE